MADITAADVKKLRDLTAAGMMECKKALQEADGDFDKAIEILRISGVAKAAKRGAERTTSNGLVAASGGALVELLCETDFVAKSEDFQALAARLVEAAATGRPADTAAWGALPLDGSTVAAEVERLAAVIGEKLELGRVAVLDEPVAVYLHRRASDLPPQVGVLVSYTGSADAARGAAMQVAALKASYVTRDQVPADLVEDERRVAQARALEEGKPAAALPKIVEGRVNAFYKDSVLLEQESVHEAKKTVKAVLDEAGTTVTAFVRFEVGQP
ncbi:MAG: elongation factor Ts [Actinomycetota bacterium]|nr:MAG: elongation factor Ts [Actinomycetota bacterium]